MRRSTSLPLPRNHTRGAFAIRDDETGEVAHLNVAVRTMRRFFTHRPI